MSEREESPIARDFLLYAVCWGMGQEGQDITATQAYITAAGFDATATCAPVFGGILPQDFEGPDGVAATEWLRGVIGARGWRGRYESEVEHLTKALLARASSEKAPTK